MAEKRIYRVSITAEVLVCAESEEDAEELAEDAWYDIRSDETFSFSAGVAKHIAANEKDSLPWGYRDEANPDRTVGEWLALAPAKPEAKAAPAEPTFAHQTSLKGTVIEVGCDDETSAWFRLETPAGEIKVPCSLDKARTAPLYGPVSVLVLTRAFEAKAEKGGR